MEWISDPNAWAALATLTILEIVLGVNNIVFISVLAGRLPEAQREKARIVGLSLAMITRILLLLSLAWMMKLTTPLFTLLQHAFSGRDLILLGGGVFLIWKSTNEVHHQLEGEETDNLKNKSVSFSKIIFQILVLDIVFSLDSVITAIGMASEVTVMVLAIVISVIVMMFAAKPIGDFVDKHPTVKMLALSFLILIGVTLLGEGLSFHIPKGYVYFAMAFSLAVEVLNLRVKSKKSKAVKLHKNLP